MKSPPNLPETRTLQDSQVQGAAVLAWRAHSPWGIPLPSKQDNTAWRVTLTAEQPGRAVSPEAAPEMLCDTGDMLGHSRT